MRWLRAAILVTMLAFLGGCQGEMATPTLAALPVTATRALPTETPQPSPTATPSRTAVPTGLWPYTVEVREPSGEGSQMGSVRSLLYLPEEYGADPDRRWPLILYLHGSGEAGEDLDLLLSQPLPEMLMADDHFPFVVVSPQIPASSGDSYAPYNDLQMFLDIWGWNPWFTRLNGLLDDIQENYAVDPQRIYLTGISMGGFGAWNYALNYPQRFAAVVPIAGGYRYNSQEAPANICDLASMGVWAFHGDQDTNVAPFQTEVMYAALKTCGGDARMTIYPGVGHWAWREAYQDEQLWDWLLSHSLQP